MELIKGKDVSENFKIKMAEEVKKMGNNVPCLVVIQVGNDPASSVYIRNKAKLCKELGIKSHIINYDDSATEEELLENIKGLNLSEQVTGILVQLPLPKNLHSEKILNAISPEKDVDCFHPVNMGKLFIGEYDTAPCTPSGIIKMLEYKNINVEGMNCVVIGRSNIVGKPIASMLLERNATVTICHSKTKNLKEICRNADLIISAVGKIGTVTDDMIKDGVVIIDVGINRDENGNLCGDVKLEDESRVSYLTPVPGGVGIMTVTMLVDNLIKLKKKQIAKEKC